MVSLANLGTDKGLADLNKFLADKSYIDGYEVSSADAQVYKEIKAAPDAKKYPHVSRWFNHVESYTVEERSNLRAGTVPTAGAAPSKAAEDELDLFGDDDEDDAEYERQLEERRKAADEAKGKKAKTTIAKSSLLLDVKPWDDETPMEKLEESVRSIIMEGLVWGASKLVPVGYGIKKLQINAVVVDDLVSVEDLEEKICSFEDYVQSMDVAAFNKI
jgi:elongation factor 1-beta